MKHMSVSVSKANHVISRIPDLLELFDYGAATASPHSVPEVPEEKDGM